MSHIAGHDRSQTLLLPESLDDYVGPENPVRFIEAFVDGLDLSAAGFVREKINYVNKLACDDCKIRSQCTSGKFRTVPRLENEAVLDWMTARLATRPGVLDRRRETVEHPFSTIKQ